MVTCHKVGSENVKQVKLDGVTVTNQKLNNFPNRRLNRIYCRRRCKKSCNLNVLSSYISSAYPIQGPSMKPIAANLEPNKHPFEL